MFTRRRTTKQGRKSRPGTQRAVLRGIELLEYRTLLSVSPIGPEFQVNTFTAGNQETMPDYPQSVAMDSDGDFVVTWTSWNQDGDGPGVFGQLYDSAGTKVGGEFQINTTTLSSQMLSTVAMDSDGDFVVTWTSVGQDGDQNGIFGQRYDSAGTKVGGEFQINTTTLGAQMFSTVAMDSDGDFVVTWTSSSQDGSGSGIFGQRYDAAGNPLGGEFQINTTTVDVQQRSTVAMDSGGNFVVTWTSLNQDGDRSGVFGQRYDAAGNKLGAEFQINTTTASYQQWATVAMDSDGDFVVAWSSHDQAGSGWNVFGQRFDAAGNPLGGEFQINTWPYNDQLYSTAAMDSSGDFVVTWTSYGQDSSGSGVFGQRFGEVDVPGALDPSFGVDGMVLTDLQSHAEELGRGIQFQSGDVAFQSDGKSIVVGTSESGNMLAARYDTDGSLDTAFGSNGIASVDIGGFDGAFSVAIDANDRVVMAGFTTSNFDPSTFDIAVARLTANGILDTTFADNGKRTIDFGNNDIRDAAYDVVIDDLGRITVAGESFPSIVTGGDIAIARLTEIGDFDTTFGNGGKTLVDFGNSVSGKTDDRGRGIAIDSQGRVLVAGITVQPTTGEDMAVARLTENGSLDTSFNADGRQTVNFNASDYGLSLAIDGVDRAVIGGWSDQGGTIGQEFAVARLTAIGERDSSFGTDGKRLIDLGSTEEKGRSIAVDSANRILIVGETNQGGQTAFDFGVARLTEDGGDDSNFSGDGTRTIDFGQADDFANGVAIDGDGRILVAGFSAQGVTGADFAVARLLSGTPTADAGADQTVNEGDSVSLHGSFTDSDVGDTHTFLWKVSADNGQVVPDGTAQDFSFIPMDNGTYTLTLEVTDSDGAVGADTATITVNNVAPKLVDQSYTTAEDNARVLNVLNGTDDVGAFGVIDPGTLDTHTAVAGLFTTAAGGSVSIAADGQATYTPPPDFFGSDSFDVSVVDDDGDGDIATVTLTITPVNDAPINNVPGLQNTPEDAALVFSALGANVIAISDVDAGTNPVQVTLTSAVGTLSLSSVGGLSFTIGDGADDATMTFSGMLADINRALNGLVFAPMIDYSGPATIEVLTNDLGNSGAGGALTDLDVVTIDVLSSSEQIAQIDETIAALTFEGSSTSLTGKLDAATASFDSGNTTSGVNQLNAFINQINAWIKMGKVSATDGQTLIDAANTAIESASTSSGAALVQLGTSISSSSATVAPVTSAHELLTGAVGVFFDESQIPLTSQQRSRFDDSLDTLNIAFGPYGVSLIEVAVRQDAVLIVEIADTSACGSAADGVLGCTTAGRITLLSGWDWYAGADPGPIGGAQFDLQTIMTHELGHSAGLGHSGDDDSVMFELLGAAEIRHDLTAEDMVLLEANDGPTPEALMAADGRSGAAVTHRGRSEPNVTPFPSRSEVAAAGAVAGETEDRGGEAPTVVSMASPRWTSDTAPGFVVDYESAFQSIEDADIDETIIDFDADPFDESLLDDLAIWVTSTMEGLHTATRSDSPLV